MDWLAFIFSSSLMKKTAIVRILRFLSYGMCGGVSGRYPSGQRGQTVNLLPSASKVRILACPPQP